MLGSRIRPSSQRTVGKMSSVSSIARRLAKLALASAVFAPWAWAQETESPGLDLLEYLGSWQEDDEEWLAVAEWEDTNEDDSAARKDERKDDEKDT